LDTAGQEEYFELREVYMRGGEGFVIVYSITDSNSFKEAREMKSRIQRVKDKSNVPIVLVGNKADLKEARAVPSEEGTALAKDFGCAFFESSAQTGQNCLEVYEYILKEVIKRQDEDFRLQETQKKK